ncbi:MAG: arsenate reductase [Moraxellaceae bacterium]|jgi:arsenate reductase|nr:arsenate reductase [Moraxellaceae bacterium]
MATIYGIKNCDTMKKAFAWLEANGVAYDFHDYKKSGIDAATLARWEKTLGWEILLNRRGTTWRKLDAAMQASIDRASALRLMQEQPSLIKRPVLESKGVLLCGLDAEAWRQALRTA